MHTKKNNCVVLGFVVHSVNSDTVSIDPSFLYISAS